MTSSLNINNIQFEEKLLYKPSLDELKNVLQNSMTNNFEEVTVEVVDCPNLKNSPYHLADSGLGGSPTLIEVGGPPYLLPNVDKTKIYDIQNIIDKVIGPNLNKFAIGAGAGPFMIHNTNCEGIYNLRINQFGIVDNHSYTARVGPTITEDCILEKFPNSETRCALLLNLFVCESKPGKVLRIYCRKRIGKLNFIECIRTELLKQYKNICVGLGGIFLVRNGNIHQHVMRDFSKTEITTEEQLNSWLKFYNMPGQLNAVGTLVTHDNDLDLRLQHFHSFSEQNWGGHYHYDTTPDTIEYEGYFNVAERIVRVDKPINTHQFGRD